MIPKKAIEKAISGGWLCAEYRDPVQFGEIQELPSGDIRIHFYDPQSSQEDWFDYRPETIALDRTFWECLSKALDWEREHDIWCTHRSTKHRYKCNCYKDKRWKKNAENFYDLILIGGCTDAYWEQRLRNV